MYAIKTPDGKLIQESLSDSKIGAALSGADCDADLFEIVNGIDHSWDNSATLKRVKRSKYKVVQVKLVEVK